MNENEGHYKIVLSVTPDMNSQLQGLCYSLGVDQARLFRTMVALLKAVVDGYEQGWEPALVDKDGNVMCRLVGIRGGEEEE